MEIKNRIDIFTDEEDYGLDKESLARRKKLYRATLQKFKKLMKITQPEEVEIKETPLELYTDFGKGKGPYIAGKESTRKAIDLPGPSFIPKSTIVIKAPNKPSVEFLSRQPRMHSEAKVVSDHLNTLSYYDKVAGETRASSFVNLDPDKYNLCQIDVFEADDRIRGRWGASIGNEERFGAVNSREHHLTSEARNGNNAMLAKLGGRGGRPFCDMKEKVYVVSYNPQNKTETVVRQKVRQVAGYDSLFGAH